MRDESGTHKHELDYVSCSPMHNYEMIFNFSNRLILSLKDLTDDTSTMYMYLKFPLLPNSWN